MCVKIDVIVIKLYKIKEMNKKIVQNSISMDGMYATCTKAGSNKVGA